MRLAKLTIISLLGIAFIFTSVDMSAKKKKKRSSDDSYLSDKALFFGGLNGGMSLSQIDGDNFSGYRKIDINFSAIGHTQLGNGLTISTELGYNKKGSVSGRNETPFRNANGDTIDLFQINLNYAEIALLGNVFDKKGNNVGMGAAYGRLLNGKERTDGVEVESNFPFQENTLDWVLNGNLLISKKVPGLFFNVRFQYSILPVRIDYYGQYGRNQQISKQILLRLNYTF